MRVRIVFRGADPSGPAREWGPASSPTFSFSIGDFAWLTLLWWVSDLIPLRAIPGAKQWWIGGRTAVLFGVDDCGLASWTYSAVSAAEAIAARRCDRFSGTLQPSGSRRYSRRHLHQCLRHRRNGVTGRAGTAIKAGLSTTV